VEVRRGTIEGSRVTGLDPGLRRDDGLGHASANPESRIPNPESRIPNPESRIPNPE